LEYCEEEKRLPWCRTVSFRPPFRSSLFRPGAVARQGDSARPGPPALLPPLSWLAFSVIALATALTLLWLVFGRVERLADGRGLVIRDSEFGIYEVAGLGGGQLAEVLVKEGDAVEAGQPVARFHRAELRARIEAAEQLLVAEKKNPAPGEDLVELELRIQELRIKYDQESLIRSERAGRVVEVVSSAGNVIPPGRTVLRLESLTGPYEVLAYVSAREGKKIKPGMEVRIVPTTASALANGHLRGRVNYVSVYPVTRDYLTSELGGNARLADYLLNGGSSIEVDIDLLRDPVSGDFAWSPRPGRAVDVESGLLVEAFVVLEKSSPSSLILSR
jgi:HlyD family secretion protein